MTTATDRPANELDSFFRRAISDGSNTLTAEDWLAARDAWQEIERMMRREAVSPAGEMANGVKR